jgi:hypothetical protein
MARPSSSVSVCVAPVPVDTPRDDIAPGDTVSMFEPSDAICCATLALAPSPSATVATTAATAMMMPMSRSPLEARMPPVNSAVSPGTGMPIVSIAMSAKSTG